MAAAAELYSSDLSDYPAILRSKDVARILRIHEKTVLVAAHKGDRAKVPSPALLRPYRWRKKDVQAFIDGASESDQRRALMRARG